MEEDLMRSSNRHASREPEQGFSLVEMLLTAFILAVGIMGLTLLQVMAMKGARGGRSLSTAVQLGDMVMDQIELEGRLTWLNRTASGFSPGAVPLQFVNKTVSAAPIPFNVKGLTPVANAPQAVDSATFFNVTFSKNDVIALGVGIISDFMVDVAFSDATDPVTNAPIMRHVVVRRRILHA
jgi:prepilin-type N-terminal cleavage/methylation domain-containing protein